MSVGVRLAPPRSRRATVRLCTIHPRSRDYRGLRVEGCLGTDIAHCKEQDDGGPGEAEDTPEHRDFRHGPGPCLRPCERPGAAEAFSFDYPTLYHPTFVAPTAASSGTPSHLNRQIPPAGLTNRFSHRAARTQASWAPHGARESVRLHAPHGGLAESPPPLDACAWVAILPMRPSRR